MSINSNNKNTEDQLQSDGKLTLDKEKFNLEEIIESFKRRLDLSSKLLQKLYSLE